MENVDIPFFVKREIQRFDRREYFSPCTAVFQTPEFFESLTDMLRKFLQNNREDSAKILLEYGLPAYHSSKGYNDSTIPSNSVGGPTYFTPNKFYKLTPGIYQVAQMLVRYGSKELKDFFVQTAANLFQDAPFMDITQNGNEKTAEIIYGYALRSKIHLSKKTHRAFSQKLAVPQDLDKLETWNLKQWGMFVDDLQNVRKELLDQYADEVLKQDGKNAVSKAVARMKAYLPQLPNLGDYFDTSSRIRS